MLVIHDINFASAYSDHIVAMKDGRVVLQGTPEEVIAPGPLRQVFDLDVQVHELDGQRIAVYYD